MKEVILFFPDTQKLADYTALLQAGPVEISSLQLTLKACLNAEQIADARVVFEAVPCCAATWEKLEQWFGACRKSPGQRMNGYPWTTTMK